LLLGSRQEERRTNEERGSVYQVETVKASYEFQSVIPAEAGIQRVSPISGPFFNGSTDVSQIENIEGSDRLPEEISAHGRKTNYLAMRDL
jgi:hypothetical protein